MVCHEEVGSFVPKFGYPRAAALLYHQYKPIWKALDAVLDVVQDICEEVDRDVAELAAGVDAIDKNYPGA